jgi:hypothetical protein
MMIIFVVSPAVFLAWFLMEILFPPRDPHKPPSVFQELAVPAVFIGLPVVAVIWFLWWMHQV